MAKVKLTKRFIDSLDFSDKATVYQDEVVNGFAVRTHKTTKSYMISKRINGKMIRKSLGDCSIMTLQDARESAMSAIAILMKGENPFESVEPITVPTLAEAYQYYVSHKPSLKPKTIATYDRQIKGKLSDWLDMPLNDIMQSHITEKHLELTRVSPSQANATMRALNAVWNFARLSYLDKSESTIIKPSPIDILTAKRLWNVVKPRTRHLNEDTMGNYVKILLNFRSEDFHTMQPHSNNARDIMLLFLCTGIRASEGYNLKWDNIDLQHGTMTITETKNSDPLHLPLGRVIHSMLRHRYLYGATQPWVFPSRIKSCETGLTDISKQYGHISDMSGIHITPHDLRRTFSTVGDILNTNMSVIKRLMNHRNSTSSDDVTLQYIQVSQKRLRVAMNEIEEFIFNEAGMSQDDVIQKLYTCKDYSL
ncbi:MULTISPECIES: tyrosine-type recombinase/integrase [unclassified Psychrobacter]|uniref:tyrosine-type recombinase/integrase n=1 Tax=unclassified Psychrobacter TaxID=196806 RepID=UPI0018F6D84F|nr:MULTISPECIES: tyrosine-type recombinase/integrase [unclassified Psychrobacter]